MPERGIQLGLDRAQAEVDDAKYRFDLEIDYLLLRIRLGLPLGFDRSIYRRLWFARLRLKGWQHLLQKARIVRRLFG